MLRRIVVSAAIISALAAATLAQRAYTVGTATAAPGQRADGYLDVPAGTDAATRIPVIIINGAKPGPVLALVSGAHGTEYASIIALEKLPPRIDPAQLSGTVVLLPLVNIPSFLQKVPHVNPVDNKSMNRFYPGKADGTQTERASFLITKEVVDRCDYLIDYHGGDLDESLRPYAYWGPTGQGRAGPHLAKTWSSPSASTTSSSGANAPPIPPPRATSTTPPPSTASPPSSLKPATPAPQKPTTSRLLVNGTLSTMRALKMLPGATRTQSKTRSGSTKSSTSSADTEGIFYPYVKRGTYVSANSKLGHVTDFFGKVILEPRAPESGVVLHVNAVPSLKPGDNIANIGVVAPHAP